MGKYLLIFVCLCALTASAQEPEIKRKTIIAAEIGAPGIGLAAEWNHGRAFTVETAVFLGPSYDIDDGFLSFFVIPDFKRPAARFSVTPRVYLNMQSRLKERKKKYTQVDVYLGFGYSYVTRSFDKFNAPSHFFTLHTGLRQFFSARGSITAHGGIGYAVNPAEAAQTFYPSLSLKLGYRIN